MVEQQEFQIPQQLRELAEKSVEQARLAYGQFLDGMAEAVRAWSTVPSAVMTSGFKAVQEGAIQFAKENAEAGFALASELAQSKGPAGGPGAPEQFCPETDAVLRAAGAGARPAHGGGHAQRRAKGLSAPIRACLPELRTMQPSDAGQGRLMP
jgi:hypothetical protein